MIVTFCRTCGSMSEHDTADSMDGWLNGGHHCVPLASPSQWDLVTGRRMPAVRAQRNRETYRVSA